MGCVRKRGCKVLGRGEVGNTSICTRPSSHANLVWSCTCNFLEGLTHYSVHHQVDSLQLLLSSVSVPANTDNQYHHSKQNWRRRGGGWEGGRAREGKEGREGRRREGGEEEG